MMQIFPDFCLPSARLGNDLVSLYYHFQQQGFLNIIPHQPPPSILRIYNADSFIKPKDLLLLLTLVEGKIFGGFSDFQEN